MCLDLRLHQPNNPFVHLVEPAIPVVPSDRERRVEKRGRERERASSERRTCASAVQVQFLFVAAFSFFLNVSSLSTSVVLCR